jgi:hypothetical protein
MAFYLETSAFLKLAVAEGESPAVRSWFTRQRPCWSSHLLTTEARRAAARPGLSREVIDELLDGVSLFFPSASTFDVAGRLDPPSCARLTLFTWPQPASSARTSRRWCPTTCV